ncbi:Glycoside hydrolase family 79 protein [Mycena kentingensis (nom. inval.)]|nr:Glycoside hydrolase family 79 protein [Mycena kentingensis (nom. inval.)]
MQSMQCLFPSSFRQFLHSPCILSSLNTNAPSFSPSLISLSIEQVSCRALSIALLRQSAPKDRWQDWVQSEFFSNILHNLAQLTGAPPGIRIGANSEDKTDFLPAVESAQCVFPPPSANVPYPEASSIVVGDAYYQMAYRLPLNTVDVNFGQANITAAFLEARAIMDSFASPVFYARNISLDYLEIGNEPDLYMNNGARGRNYSSSQFIFEWTTFANNISASVNLSRSDTRFLVGSFAGSSSQLTGFSPQAIYNGGILRSPAGARIAAYSQHHYSGSFCTGSGGLLEDLMTKATIQSNLTIYSLDILATRGHGLDYVLGEMNSWSPTEIACNHTRIAGYAAYEDAQLVRAVFINSQGYLRSTARSRTSVHLDLVFEDDGPVGIDVKRLEIGYADDVSGVRWGGQTYETDTGRVAGDLQVEERSVEDGVDVAETEVVLVSFIYATAWKYSD